MTYSRRFLVLPLMLGVSCDTCEDTSGPVVCTAVRATISVMTTPYNGCQENAFNTGGNLSVASSSGGADYRDLNFSAAAAVGTTTIGPGVPTSFQFENSSGAVWIAGQGQGSGSLTIATLTATGATGTFQFVATPASVSATGNVTVSSGTFNVTF